MNFYCFFALRLCGKSHFYQKCYRIIFSGTQAWARMFLLVMAHEIRRRAATLTFQNKSGKCLVRWQWGSRPGRPGLLCKKNVKRIWRLQFLSEAGHGNKEVAMIYGNVMNSSHAVAQPTLRNALAVPTSLEARGSCGEGEASRGSETDCEATHHWRAAIHNSEERTRTCQSKQRKQKRNNALRNLQNALQDQSNGQFLQLKTKI